MCVCARARVCVLEGEKTERVRVPDSSSSVDRGRALGGCVCVCITPHAPTRPCSKAPPGDQRKCGSSLAGCEVSTKH